MASTDNIFMNLPTSKSAISDINTLSFSKSKGYSLDKVVRFCQIYNSEAISGILSTPTGDIQYKMGTSKSDPFAFALPQSCVYTVLTSWRYSSSNLSKGGSKCYNSISASVSDTGWSYDAYSYGTYQIQLFDLSGGPVMISTDTYEEIGTSYVKHTVNSTFLIRNTEPYGTWFIPGIGDNLLYNTTNNVDIAALISWDFRITFILH